MKTVQMAGQNFSSIAAGCMRISEMTAKEVDSFIKGAIELGINFFDHADIYGGGKCEQVFGSVLKAEPSLRNKITLQSKCGIVPGHGYDFSYEHIITSVEGSLKRLNIDSLDFLLLHRPDTLVEPQEVAKAFNKLQRDGKVKNFGVSNFNSMQIELLKTAVKQPITANQLQFSAAFTGMVDSGICVNTKFDGSINRDGSILEYSRINDITIQAWSPYQHGFFGGTFIGAKEYPDLNKVLDRLSAEYSVTPNAIATAFILRHPAKWQVITGTTKLSRLQEAAEGAKLTLTRAQWYEIYAAAGNTIP